MRFVIQRVLNAEVKVNNETIGRIGKGFAVLIGICEGDTEAEADRLVKKLLGLRIFDDENGKTNLSLDDEGGSLLLISQFTLYADCRKGYRPGFSKAMEPIEAERLYGHIIKACREGRPGMTVETGSFGADMKVSLTNDGPFTVILDSAEL